MAPQGAKTKSEFLAMTLALFFLLGLAHAFPIPGRTDFDPDEIYYMNGNIRCLRCSPGFYVLNHCTSPDSLGTCAPCHPGHTYSEHLTGLTYCLPCTVCRTDQREESPCTTTKNSVCQCKEGTFCPADESCEICQKCTTSCPPNEVIRAPCNSTADTECAPPEPGINLTAILVPVGIVLLLLLVGACVWFFYIRKSIENSKWIPKILTVSLKCDEASEEDTETPFLSPMLCLKENITENERNEAINDVFNTFVDLVPADKFERFVRKLGLSNNDIENTKQDNRGAENQRYAMLSQLHQDKKFDVNIGLSKLDSIKLGKVVQEITAKLMEDGWFERST
ncbi:tumor necrosis factor receptor superfamily member 10B-like [Phyllobates terribilis]|uniref:tumor necrosis factor receptor superfamily member 10B-like n=1 Tax=Phyllobates terribilis TaxID=111132 RepID=UPI003CCB5D69